MTNKNEEPETTEPTTEDSRYDQRRLKREFPMGTQIKAGRFDNGLLAIRLDLSNNFATKIVIAIHDYPKTTDDFVDMLRTAQLGKVHKDLVGITIMNKFGVMYVAKLDDNGAQLQNREWTPSAFGMGVVTDGHCDGEIVKDLEPYILILDTESEDIHQFEPGLDDETTEEVVSAFGRLNL